ncbi:TIGR03087 family PEP-CTERM/XrtA system glycosyltransferase [Blastomonas sp. CACIA14H2]|uniref:TIGR03087 family PEP-CTERM/XrtA system glycosyltransferase n=1 Tax=Blastomonas sp. CACIA14H2 TaxID=1419876 RepID=UPI000414E591
MGELLFLAHRIPFPPDRGDKIRSHAMLKALAARGPVHVATFGETDADMAAEAELAWTATSHVLVRRTISNLRAGLNALPYGKPVSLVAFESDEIRHYVSRLIATRPIDTIFVFSGQMAQFIPSSFAGRVVIDFVDMDSAKFAAYAQTALGPMKLVHAREARLLGAFEQQMARRAHLSLFCSPHEVAEFRLGLGDPQVRVDAVVNGIDTVFYDPGRVEAAAYPGVPGPHMVFTGQMDYAPNVDAVTHFAEAVLPRVQERFPNAWFHIIGRNPAPAVRALAARHGVDVVGAVDDIRPWIASANMVVAPLRIARGIQNKVLEAMAMARPVIASAAAAEGIEAVTGEHFLVAPSDDAMVDAVCSLAADPDRGAAMGAAARAHMLAHYQWNAQLAPLLAWLDQPAALVPSAA